MRNGRLEKVLRNRRAREPADQLSYVPCSIPPPMPSQSRKGSAVQDFDCCPVLHFASVCEKEMRFFPLSFIPALTMFPSPKGSSHSCRPAGALSSFCPFVSTDCSRLASGKVFLAWSLSVLAQEVPGPVVPTQAESSFRHPRSGLARKPQQLSGRWKPGNTVQTCSSTPKWPFPGKLQDSYHGLLPRTLWLLMEAAPSWAICKLIISTS